MILEETKQVAQASTSSRWWCPGFQKVWYAPPDWCCVWGRTLCTFHQQIFAELNGVGEGVGDNPWCYETHSLWRGMSKANQHKFEVEYGTGLRGTNADGEMCARSKKWSKASGKRKHLGLVWGKWEHVKERNYKRTNYKKLQEVIAWQRALAWGINTESGSSGYPFGLDYCKVQMP